MIEPIRKIAEEKQTDWSPEALDLVQKRYLVGFNISCDEWLKRVTEYICRFEGKLNRQHKTEQYYQLLKNRYFFPTSAALINSLKKQGGLAGCIVLPLEKSTKNIFAKSLPEIAKVLMSGTGVGIDLSHLPPRLSEEEGRAHAGPVEILKSITTAVDGPLSYSGVKRAAFMATLEVSHPDIFEFIVMKQNRSIPSVNISVTVDRVFTEAAQRGAWLPLKHDKKALTVKDLKQMQQKAVDRFVQVPDLYVKDLVVYSRAVDRAVGRVLGHRIFVDTSVLLDVIAQSAHSCGDPGIINLAAINEENPTFTEEETDINSGRGPIKVTTPCGEQPLLPYEVCHLGSINLSKFASNGTFDFQHLSYITNICVNFMDDLLDAGLNELPEIRTQIDNNRKIGIGIMGLADVMAELEIPYNSSKAYKLAEQIMACIQDSSETVSQNLARQKGAFKNWESSQLKKQGQKIRRHATLTTVAPTGHISTLANCSTGIEPYFLLRYHRQAGGVIFQDNPILNRKLAEWNYSLDQWINDSLRLDPNNDFHGSLQVLSDAPTCDEALNLRLQELKKIFVTSHDITPDDHLQMLKAVQNHVENGVSKTINLPEHAEVSDIKHILMIALDQGIKGITVFRDKCLTEQALSAVNKEKCPSCGSSKYLKPSDCKGLKCDSNLGGCGYEDCST